METREAKFRDYLTKCGSSHLLSSVSVLFEKRLDDDGIDDSRIDLLNEVSEQKNISLKAIFNDASFIKHGIEAPLVFRADNATVIKVWKQEESVKERISYFNDLFGNRTRYEEVGGIKWHGQNYVILRQPYIEFETSSWREAREQLFYDMKNRFGDAEEHPWRPQELHLPDWFLDDLKSANVGIDVQTHNYAVIDCIIHKPGEIPDHLLWDIDRRQ